MGKNLGLNKIILSKKYSNFSNMFDKTQIDVLVQYSQHNLVIELKPDKQSFLSLFIIFLGLSLM